MANIAINPDVREGLLKFAEEFDDEAAKLDLAAAGDSRAVIKGASET
jgi:hypothetical protein